MQGVRTVLTGVRATDTVLAVKLRLRALNPMLFVRRQRLAYMNGPSGIQPLADDATLGGASVAQDGSVLLDLLLVDETAADTKRLGDEVCCVLDFIYYARCFVHYCRGRAH
jgi:hypothetical protein